MIQNVLHQKLRPLIDAEKTLKRRRALSLILALGTVAAGVLFWLAFTQLWWSWPAILYTAGGVIAAAMAVVWWAQSRTISVREVAEKIEKGHPDLQLALLTAVEQQPGKDGQLGYLQERVIFEAVDHAVKHNWVKRISRGRLIGAAWVQGLAAIAFCFVMFALMGQVQRTKQIVAAAEAQSETVPDAPLGPYEISVNPGDAEVERGARLIVEAKFGEKRIPPDAMIVIRDPGEEGAERGRIPMRAGLDETAFSGLIAKIDKDAIYRIDFDGESSDEFTITTYVHPQLEQADAKITPPEYAKQEPKKIEDTRKVSLLEGSELEWKLKVNKPVAAAELFGEDETVIPLAPSADDPTLLVASHAPEETQKYRLHLIDEKDRANKRPPWFTVTVKRNLPPKLDFVFPKRDVEVSAIEELPVEAKVWDDLGVVKAGATFTFGDETRDIELASAELPGGKNHPLETLFTMEDLGAEPRDLVAYHLWAEDLGPDGKTRRTASDMFFAEVRHFEDIFREQENMGGGGEPPPGGGGGQSEELLKIQKDVMNATWKLIRRADMGRTYEELGSDIAVVKESQTIAIGKTNEAIEEAEDAQVKAFFTEAIEHMGLAVEILQKAIDFQDTKQLRPAHDAERKAYETLIRARSREHNIMLAQQPPGQGQGQQSAQEQMMQLEMKQKELRYEEQSEAQNPEATAEQQENLAVLNRLKDLARRQEAIAKKIKELEAALEEAETEEEKQELERQLKRLQEEQEQLLRELDELGERMDTEENRANMAEEREQLEETRESVKEASDKLEEGKLADAANAATRAQEKLEEVKEDFRKKTSRQFADEMREVRKQARELAENQEEIGKKYEDNPAAGEEPGNPFSGQNSPLENAEMARELDGQRKSLGELLDKMQEISEQSEDGEPLLSDALYEAYRKAKMSGVEESLGEARDLTRYNRREIAQESERAAARGIDELKEDVEKAAEKVLGSEADALRLARSELENLIDQAKEEAERLGGQQGEGENPGETELAMNEPGQRTEDGAETPGEAAGSENRQPGEGQESENPREGQQPGEGEGQGQEPQEGQPGEGQEGPDQEKGKGQGKGESQEPGEGEGKSEQPGQQKGKGKGKGQGEGEGESEGEPSDQGKGKGKSQGQGEGEGEGEGESEGEQSAQAQGKGKGKGQGEGEGESEGEQSAQAQGKGKGKGKGQGEGEGESEGDQSSQAQGKGKGKGQGQGQQPGSQPGGSQAGGGANNSGLGGPNQGGGDDRRQGSLPRGIANAGRPLFFDGADEAEPEGPITGEDFEEWSDSLRNVEDMLEQDDLRNEVAKVLDNARSMRIDYRRDNLPPQAETIRNRITNPLTELRDRVAEELAKLDKDNPLAPIDRDPVPREFRELVRRYYEELGSGQ